MGAKSSIEWTDATWNPIRGCTRKSPGCGGPGKAGGCYAEKIAARFSGPGQPFEGFAERTADGGRWTGKLALIEKLLTVPLRWKKPRRIFVNSMSDLFHENLPDDDIARVIAYIAGSYWHTHQVLTKRPERACDLLNDLQFQHLVEDYLLEVDDDAERCHLYDPLDRRTDDWRAQCPDVMGKDWPLKNLWLGTSCERQQEADERIPHLLQTPAAIRFVSLEPLLGPIDLENLPSVSGVGRYLNALSTAGAAFSDIPHMLDWVIVGGESGHSARPMNPQWARDIRDQCEAADVAFFHKQNGEFVSVSEVEGPGAHYTFPDGRTVRRIGKKLAGRTLDHVEHNGMPEVHHA